MSVESWIALLGGTAAGSYGLWRFVIYMAGRKEREGVAARTDFESVTESWKGLANNAKGMAEAAVRTANEALIRVSAAEATVLTMHGEVLTLREARRECERELIDVHRRLDLCETKKKRP